MNRDEGRTVEENRRLVYMVVNELYRQGRIYAWEMEDMYQEGMIGLLNAARTYRKESGTAFSTFAVKCIRNEVLDRLARMNAQRRQPNRAHPSLEQKLMLGKDGGAVTLGNVLPSDMDVEEETLGLTVDDIQKLLKGYGRESWFEALMRNINGETLEAIAGSKGVTRQYIGKMVVDARRYIADEVRKRAK